MTGTREIRAWYNRKYRTLGRDAFRPYRTYPIFLDYLDAPPGRNILDIGCGSSHLLKAADRRGLSPFGVDISIEAIKIARNISPSIPFFVSQGEALPFFDDSFDYLSCLGVLEHFLDISMGLREMKRVTKKDAVFCIMVPNRNFFHFLINRVPGTEQQDINENLLTLGEWKNILRREGLIISRIYSEKWYDKGEDRRFSLLHPLKTLKSMARVALEHICPLRLSYQFIFICKKC